MSVLGHEDRYGNAQDKETEKVKTRVRSRARQGMGRNKSKDSVITHQDPRDGSEPVTYIAQEGSCTSCLTEKVTLSIVSRFGRL